VFLFICDTCERATAMHASVRPPSGWEYQEDDTHLCPPCSSEDQRDREYSGPVGVEMLGPDAPD
jgi:hypothetical protein